MVSKDEIACFGQFLLLSPCFKKAVCCRGLSQSVYMRERVNKKPHQQKMFFKTTVTEPFLPYLQCLSTFLSNIQEIRQLSLCSRRLFENLMTKEEIAQNEQFLLLPQCFPI